MENTQLDNQADSQEDEMLNRNEFQEAYGAPEQEQQSNAHTFLREAVFDSQDTTKTSFLTESELGRPLFNVRFLADIYDICRHYLDPICKQLNISPEENNRIAKYFWEKSQNVTNTGMSNKGFAMQLNVTRKLNTTRERIKNLEPQRKGGVNNE